MSELLKVKNSPINKKEGSVLKERKAVTKYYLHYLPNNLTCQQGRQLGSI